MEERTIKIKLNTAKKWYKQGGELKEAALQAFSEDELKESLLPNSWKKFYENFDRPYYYINSYSDIVNVDYSICLSELSCRNMLPTEKLAKKFRAYMQLMTLRQSYIQDWVPDWNEKSIKWYIGTRGNENYISFGWNIRVPLSFPTEKLAQKFMNNFEELEKYIQLLYDIENGKVESLTEKGE